MAGLVNELKEVNSEARQYTVCNAEVPIDEILNMGGFDLKKVERGISGCASFHSKASAKSQEHQHEIESTSVTIEGGLEADLFQTWIDNFVQFHAENLYRSKGIIAIAGYGSRLIFQGVHGMLGGVVNFHHQAVGTGGDRRAGHRGHVLPQADAM